MERFRLHPSGECVPLAHRLLFFFHTALGSYAAEDCGVRHGHGTETVAAVDASGYLAGCVQSGNRLSVGVYDTGIRVDLQSAHGVVYGHHAGEHEIGSPADLV